MEHTADKLMATKYKNNREIVANPNSSGAFLSTPIF